MKICFIASSGGHLDQLMMLKPLMEKHQTFIVTENTKFKTFKCSYYLPQINRREIKFVFKFILIILISIYILLKERPDYIISTGALASVPMCCLGKLLKKKVIFIESFAKKSNGTISGKIVYKFADLFIIQWETLRSVYPNAIYGGGIY